MNKGQQAARVAGWTDETGRGDEADILPAWVGAKGSQEIQVTDSRSIRVDSGHMRELDTGQGRLIDNLRPRMVELVDSILKVLNIREGEGLMEGEQPITTEGQQWRARAEWWWT
ncbi:hypothetical protein AX15_004530 [Amanita polypyramis BW_CC]|nr:hypothetical protein AX15_004530 [Amanita polypyramis BW_CC]